MSTVRLVLFLFLLFAPFPALALESFTARVVAVPNGDAITVLTADNKQIDIRLYGIDCPEYRQAFGVLSRQTTMGAVYEENVAVQPLYQDRFDRTVAIVSIDGKTLQEILIREGVAWVYPKYCTEEEICAPLQRLEEEARAQRKGLWAEEKAMPPWKWRAR